MHHHPNLFCLIIFDIKRNGCIRTVFQHLVYKLFCVVCCFAPLTPKLFSFHKLRSDIRLIELAQFHGYDSYYTIDLFKIQFCGVFLPLPLFPAISGTQWPANLSQKDRK